MEDRKAIIQKFADEVQKCREDAARIVAEDSEKPLWAARTEIDSLVNKVQTVFDVYE